MELFLYVPKRARCVPAKCSCVSYQVPGLFCITYALQLSTRLLISHVKCFYTGKMSWPACPSCCYCSAVPALHVTCMFLALAPRDYAMDIANPMSEMAILELRLATYRVRGLLAHTPYCRTTLCLSFVIAVLGHSPATGSLYRLKISALTMVHPGAKH